MDILINGLTEDPLFVLAHGAGAPMDSSFMESMAERLAGNRLQVARFEFDYMQKRRETGIKRPPDRQPALLERMRTVVDELGGPKQVVIGGKSMGGRMASLLAAEMPVRAVVCLGYPFHAPGKPEKVRIDHFPQINCPVLIVQGERDPFGRREEVETYPIPDHVQIYWLPDGNHDFKTREKSGISHEENMVQAAQQVAQFIREL